MASDEVNTTAKAAERRRQHKAAKGISAYSPYYWANAEDPRWPYSRQLDIDAAVLADAYLAEHPADPENLIQHLRNLTERWKSATKKDREQIERLMLSATEGMSEHPEWFDYPCLCDLCKSYA